MTHITRGMRIRGRVQGVGFRMHMSGRAHELGVHGWVRNRRDGSVEAVAQGNADAVEQLIEWARQGPPGARVTEIEVFEGSGRYTSFDVRRTE